ncbi:hypothetical protein UlMin_024609 [Ulmus minor]
MRHVACHERYLGFPTFAKRCKKDLFAFIKDRVWKKVRGWNNSIFSGAGKEILVKAVIQAIPSHAMACFKLPKSLIQDHHYLIANFWWGSNNGKTKQGWIIIKNPDSLIWHVLKACYFTRSCFFLAKKRSNASFIWRSILWRRHGIERGSHWRISSRENISVLSDRWLPRPSSFQFINPPPIPSNCVVAKLRHNNGDWNKVFVEQLFGVEKAKLVLSLPLGYFDHEDILI